MVLGHLMAVRRAHLMEDTGRHTEAVAESVALKAQENASRIAENLAEAVDVVGSVARKAVEADSLVPMAALVVDSPAQVPTEALELHMGAVLEVDTSGVKALAVGLEIAGDIVVESWKNRGAPRSHGGL